MMRRIAVAASIAMLSTSLSGSIPTSASAEEQPLIAHLMLRDHLVSISQDATGEIVYSITNENGELLDMNLNEEQLQARYPEIHEEIRPAIATPEDSDSMLLMLEGW
jgi:hypothetical protein